MMQLIGFGELLSLGCAITWAIGVVFLRDGSKIGTPLALNTFKIALATILFAITILVTKTPLDSLSQTKEILLLAISGIIGIGIADTLWLSALKRTDASTVAILDCGYSPSVIFLSFLFLGEKLTLLQLTGSALVISALLVVTLYGSKTASVKAIDYRGFIYGVLAVFFMAIGVVIMDPLLEKFPLVIAIEIRLLAGLAFLMTQILIKNHGFAEIKEIFQIPNKNSLLLGSFFTTFLSMLFWVGGTKYTTASISSVLNQTSTFFIVILAWIFLHEHMNKGKVIGCILGFIGCLMVIL